MCTPPNFSQAVRKQMKLKLLEQIAYGVNFEAGRTWWNVWRILLCNTTVLFCKDGTIYIM